MNTLTLPHPPRRRAKSETSAKPLGAAAAHPFLQGMEPDQIRRMSEGALRIRFDVDEMIFRAGDLANRFYLIQEGSVALESYSAESPLGSIQTISAGDALGWSWLYPPYRWQFDARALEPTTAILFYGTRLRQLFEEDHDFGYAMMKRMSAVMIRRLQQGRQELLEAQL